MEVRLDSFECGDTLSTFPVGSYHQIGGFREIRDDDCKRCMASKGGPCNKILTDSSVSMVGAAMRLRWTVLDAGWTLPSKVAIGTTACTALLRRWRPTKQRRKRPQNRRKSTESSIDILHVPVSNAILQEHMQVKSTYFKNQDIRTRPRNPRFKDAHTGTKRRLVDKKSNRDSGISGSDSGLCV